MTAHRIHTNRAPMDYRSGITPMDRPSLWRANWPVIVGTAALIAGLGCAVVMAAIAVGGLS